MNPITRVDEIVRVLGLAPHPEGGWYRETHRSAHGVSHPDGGGARAASTAILYLLGAGDFSAWHRVRSDEVWHWHGGGALELHTIGDGGAVEVAVLGPEWGAGQVPQAVVRAGVWQAARPAAGTEWVVCGCTVAPGFEFADFEMPGREAMRAMFPGLGGAVEAFTREGGEAESGGWMAEREGT